MQYITPIIDKNGKKNYKTLVKDNKLIQSKYYLTAGEQKLLYKLFDEVQQNNYKSKLITIKFQDFFLSYKGVVNKNITKKEFKKLLEDIQDKKIYIIKDDMYIRTQWFAIVGKLDLSEFTIDIDDYVFQYIQSLDKNFTSLRRESIYNFSSFYSMRIYELIMQWSLTKNEIAYQVDILKELLGVNEIEETKNGKIVVINKSYSNFHKFDLRILKPAIEEINEKSEIIVSYEKVYSGKKIDGIIFKFEFKKEFAEMLEEKRNKRKKKSENHNTEFKIPNILKIDEELYELFEKDFSDVNFEDSELLYLLILSQKQTLNRDNIERIGIKSYGYFKTILRTKIDSHIFKEKELKYLEELTPEEEQEWMNFYSNMNVVEFVEKIKGKKI